MTRSSSSRRLLGPALLVGAALVGLGWGAWSLADIFRVERDEAFAAGVARRRALEHYAVVALEQSMRARVEGARETIARAADDPLHPADGLYLYREGRQVLPRPRAFRAGSGVAARTLYERLMAGAPDLAPADPSDPWSERLRLRAAFLATLGAGDGDAIADSFRALLGHRARYLLAPDIDVPATLATLSAFLEQASPAAGLMHDLLRDGLEDTRGLRVEGVQRTLLRRREAFTAAEHAFLVGRVLDLCRRAGVPSEAFRDGALEAGQPIERPDALVAPTLLEGGRWFVLRVPSGEIHGVRVELPAALDGIAEGMRARAVLTGGETFSAPPLEGALELRHLRPTFRSPQIHAARSRAASAWTLKTGLLLLCATLALLLVALVTLDQVRRRRFVELKSDFVATVSHELRTPLASIRLLAETLERRLAGEERARDYPSRIVRDVDGLSFLVENILSFNRLDKGRWVARMEPVHLDDVVRSVRETLDAVRPIEWAVHGTSGIDLDADEDLLRLLLLNLCRNACQHNERDPVRLEISARDEGGRVVLDVTDNGVGVQPDARRHLFTAFWRAPGGRTRGSGLGLAICRRVVRLHRGRIDLLRTGADGSTFRVELPRARS